MLFGGLGGAGVLWATKGQGSAVVPGYGRYRARVTGYAKQIAIGRSPAVYLIRLLHQPQAIAAYCPDVLQPPVVRRAGSTTPPGIGKAVP